MSAESEAPAFVLGDTSWRRNLWVCLAGSFTTVVAMTLLLPILPIYVEQLGVTSKTAIMQWSGIAYGATFFTAALVAPLWGHLADRYGRKLMLIRASLGMSVAMSLIGLADNVWHLVALRLLAGLLGGYASGSMALIATQTPKDKSGWALGTLSAGATAGSLVGPLIGGIFPPLIGIRDTFFCVGAVIFLSFLATVFLIEEQKRPPLARKAMRGGFSSLPDKRPVIAMLVTGSLLLIASMSIEPIITLYVSQLAPASGNVALISGIVMSATALGSIVSASHLGKLADRIGHWNVVIGGLLVSAVLLVPQAFVTASWQLIALRFLMGLSLGGLIPCIAAVIRHSTPDHSAGRMLGYSISAQHAGQVIGPVSGGFIGGHFGIRAVFLGTALSMAGSAALNWWVARKSGRRDGP